MAEVPGFGNFFEYFIKDLSKLASSSALFDTKSLALQFLKIAIEKYKDLENNDFSIKAEVDEILKVITRYLQSEWDFSFEKDPGTYLKLLGRRDFAYNTLNNLEPIFMELNETLKQIKFNEFKEADSETIQEAIKQLTQVAQPMVISAELGAIIAELCQENLGYFDVPLPLVKPNNLGIVLPNVSRLADEFNTDIREVLFSVVSSELLLSVILGSSVRQDYLSVLVKEYIAEFKDLTFDFQNLGGQSLDTLMNEPLSIDQLGLQKSSGQLIASAEIKRLLSVSYGFRDYFLSVLKQRFIGGSIDVIEHLVKREVELSTGRRALIELFDINLDDEIRNKGRNFIKEIAEKEGPSALKALIYLPSGFPTESEFEDIEKWIQRIRINSGESSLF
jgi:uncharacterized protein (DUF2342 family)